MENIEKQIEKRRKEALEKDFYGVGQDIVKNLGKDDIYDDGIIRIKRDHYSQEYTGGSDDIEIFFKETSVYIGRGNDYIGPRESDIKRYVPGEWEETLDGIAEKIKNPTSSTLRNKRKKEELLQDDKNKKAEFLRDWGIQ